MAVTGAAPEEAKSSRHSTGSQRRGACPEHARVAQPPCQPVSLEHHASVDRRGQANR